MKTHKMTIDEAGRLEGSELGEYWEALEALESRRDMMSDAFEKAFDAELKVQRASLARDFRVIEIKETVERTYLQLVHIGDADYDNADDIEVAED